MSLRLLLPALACTAGCLHPQSYDGSRAWPEDPLRGLEFFVGAQQFDDPAYGSLDSTTAFGVGIIEDYGMAPLFLEGALHYGFDRDTTRLPGGERITSELSRGDLSAGLRLQAPLGRRLLPYAGIGGVLVFMDADFDRDDDVHGSTDTAFGFYWKAGLAIPLTYTTTAGFEVRGVEGGQISTEAFDADIDALQFLLVFGVAR